ncbi:hypothetical protein [Dyella sp.]|jgi:hypothetical protein|uniref:hypothetical protein n=1 Tax=Dyella sp. TaxID=1869338 RepID=UPI002CD39DBB|nr:hypothetical protein [Dyella sp.]HTC26984.1 hypothetical protein [Dyella sp.]
MKDVLNRRSESLSKREAGTVAGYTEVTTSYCLFKESRLCVESSLLLLNVTSPRC